MDQKKLEAMANAAEKGYSMDFDSPEEAKAVGAILQARKAQPKAQMQGGMTYTPPADPVAPMMPSGFSAGMKPGIVDYAPAAGIVSDAATMSHDATGTKWNQLKESKVPGAMDEFMKMANDLPDEKRWEVMRDMVKMKYQRDIDQNIAKRKNAASMDPQGYASGQFAGSAALGALAGPLGGASAAGQGLAGMATGYAMDPSPESALLGGLGGAAASKVGGMAKDVFGAGQAPRAPSRAGEGNLKAALGISLDDELNNYTDDELAEILDVIRENVPALGSARQGALNVHAGKPDPGMTQVGSIDAEMAAPVVPQRKPGAWSPQRGSPKEINFGPEGDIDADILYRGASSEDLNNMLPAGPMASRGASPNLQPRQSPIAPPGPQNVKLDVMEGPQSPPMSPPEAQAFDLLQGVAERGTPRTLKSGIQQVNHGESSLAGNGLVSTPQGAIKGAALERGNMIIGVNLPKVVDKMMSMVDSAGMTAYKGMIGGAGAGGSTKLKQLVSDVMTSEEPDVIDYLYKEMYPEYNALSLEAKNGIEKEGK